MESESKDEEEVVAVTLSPSKQQQDMAMVQTIIQDFRTNCSLLESALATDLKDPIPDLSKLMTWIEWIDGNNGTREHLVHFYG